MVHKYFDTLKRLDVDHQCDIHTDGHNYDSNGVRVTMRVKK